MLVKALKAFVLAGALAIPLAALPVEPNVPAAQAAGKKKVAKKPAKMAKAKKKSVKKVAYKSCGTFMYHDKKSGKCKDKRA